MQVRQLVSMSPSKHKVEAGVDRTGACHSLVAVEQMVANQVGLSKVVVSPHSPNGDGKEGTIEARCVTMDLSQLWHLPLGKGRWVRAEYHSRLCNTDCMYPVEGM